MCGVFIRTSSADFKNVVKWLLNNKYGMAKEYLDDILSNGFDDFINHLKDDLMAFIEPEYVDKVYRDSYYSYYASKSANMPKNCLRISFFSDDEHLIHEGEIYLPQYKYLHDRYRGFVVIRPTVCNIIGRNAISPEIVKDNGFKICKTKLSPTAGGFKFEVEAFPAASQDSETMTCAETTVWSMMEYFGTRYSEYTPLLPSTIVNILKQTTIERQLPSKGLTENDLSYIAKSCGFGPQLYHKDYFSDFNNILSCYIESGIPVMVAVSNIQHLKDEINKGTDPATLCNYTGHSVMCIGHENVTDVLIDKTASQNLGNVTMLLDYDDIKKKFVFVDDNFPPYMLDYLSSPTRRYAKYFGTGQGWEFCQIDHFVAPLYKRVYLEPNVAKGYLKELIISPFMAQLHHTSTNSAEVTMRVFLCSTRSYRNYVNLSLMSNEMKQMLTNLRLPRFIWVAELSDRNLLKRGMASGIILLDATECKIMYHKSLIVSMCKGDVLYKDGHSLLKGKISMNDFQMYYNLR